MQYVFLIRSRATRLHLVTYFLPPALERIKNMYCMGQRPFLYLYCIVVTSRHCVLHHKLAIKCWTVESGCRNSPLSMTTTTSNTDGDDENDNDDEDKRDNEHNNCNCQIYSIWSLGYCLFGQLSSHSCNDITAKQTSNDCKCVGNSVDTTLISMKYTTTILRDVNHSLASCIILTNKLDL